MIHTYEVSGMHCKSCGGKIENALRAMPQVKSAEVTLDPPAARIEMFQHVSTKSLNRAIESVGSYKIFGEGESANINAQATDRKDSLYPLILIVSYIAGAVAIIALATGHRSLEVSMRHFMAGFFLVFSFFKLLDLRGFADAYRTYDVLARALPVWALAYPFIELMIGIAYLLNAAPVITNAVALGLMLLGSVGVLKALLKKQAISCACLGTALNLPMTTVTLVEDLGMAAMAALMLFTLH